MVIAWHDAAFA